LFFTFGVQNSMSKCRRTGHLFWSGTAAFFSGAVVIFFLFGQLCRFDFSGAVVIFPQKDRLLA